MLISSSILEEGNALGLFLAKHLSESIQLDSGYLGCYSSGADIASLGDINF